MVRTGKESQPVQWLLQILQRVLISVRNPCPLFRIDRSMSVRTGMLMNLSPNRQSISVHLRMFSDIFSISKMVIKNIFIMHIQMLCHSGYGSYITKGYAYPEGQPSKQQQQLLQAIIRSDVRLSMGSIMCTCHRSGHQLGYVRSKTSTIICALKMSLPLDWVARGWDAFEVIAEDVSSCCSRSWR